MQINICGAGQWFTTIKGSKCDLHVGSIENPSTLVFISAKDYKDWLDHKWRIGPVVDLHFRDYGDNLLRQLAPRVEGNLRNDPSADSCFPVLPEHAGQAAPIPGCSDSQVAVSALHRATRCTPNSNVFQMVRLIVGHHLEVPTLSILPQSDFWKDLGADDLDGTELIMVAEEAFDIEIHDDEAEKIRTVQDMVKVVQAKICP
jgi:acyl carrier protein